MIKKIIITCFVGLFILFVSLALLTSKQIAQPLNITQERFITIEPGTSFHHFSKNMVKNDWIESRFWLRAYVRMNPEYSNIKTGTYLIKEGTTLKKLLIQLNAGHEHQFLITFIEGTTFKEWLIKLHQNERIEHTLKDVEISDIAKMLSIEHKNPEGLFFPDSYAFTQGTTDIAILKRAHEAMESHLDKLWPTRDANLPYSTPYEALILASIIEKESSHLGELSTIASVFINRLNLKMRLQTDPTIIYGLGDRYKGDIKRSHMKEKTAYNTYRINGLPPTPIAMPGLASLKAILTPDYTDYLYFVSDSYGKHVFSKTLSEHNQALREYLKALKSKNLKGSS